MRGRFVFIFLAVVFDGSVVVRRRAAAEVTD
jgi:hypothetical protein